MRFDTILFDLDGTLTDSALGITNSIMYALEHCGMPVPPRESLYRFVGPPLIEEFQKAYDVSRESAERIVRKFQVYFADRGIFENTVYDHVPEMLGLLCDAGCRLILATSKPEVFAEQIMDHFQLRPFFHTIAGSEIQETRTDKAEVISYAMEKAGITDSRRTVMVGDRSHDVIGAHENGLPALGVLYGYGSREELTAAGVDFLADSVPDAADFLLNRQCRTP